MGVKGLIVLLLLVHIVMAMLLNVYVVLQESIDIIKRIKAQKTHGTGGRRMKKIDEKLFIALLWGHIRRNHGNISNKQCNQIAKKAMSIIKLMLEDADEKEKA